MYLTLLAGILIIAVGAFASGSFSIPFGKTKKWAWEINWLVYCFSAYVLMPLIACAILCPHFMTVLSGYSFGTLSLIFILGAIYGICNLTFGLTLRFLGLSLGFMISLGLMMVLGTVIPPFIDGRLTILLQMSGGKTLIAGLMIAVVGIAISAYAGYIKDKVSGAASGGELNFKKGLLLALFVGLTGSSQALGIEQGNDLTSVFVSSGTDVLFASLPTFLVMFLGSFVVTLIWCIILALKNGSVRQYISIGQEGLAANYLYCTLAGFLWFVNLVFFGMGKSFMGRFSFTAWGILMSLTIVCATIWGICRGEWRTAGPKAKLWMYLGLLVLIVASFLIGLSSEG